MLHLPRSAPPLELTWRRLQTAAVALVAGAVSASVASAAVTFSPWETLGDVVSSNAPEADTVMLVITQPDWCPPCITLDDDILRNPDEEKVAGITEDWVVLEVNGYEATQARDLKLQGIEFLGTPTTLVIQLAPGNQTLRDGRLLGMITGHPDDYADQLDSIADGQSDIDDLVRAARETGGVHNWLALAEAYVDRGLSVRARAAYRNALYIKADEAAKDGIDADSLRAIHKRAKWDLITNVYQRLAGDHRVSRSGLDSYLDEFPEVSSTDDFVYADSWTEAHLGHMLQARSTMRHHFVERGDADGLLTYLYYAFRVDDEETWADAEPLAEAGAEQYPDHAAEMHAAHGRLLRRLERGNEALEAFATAIELTAEDDPKRRIYQSQFDYLKRNPIRLQ